MEYLRKLSLGAGVSFVLCPVDDFTGEPASAGTYRIIFPYCCRAPLYKQDGFVVFCGLPAGDYSIDILSERYHNENITICVPAADVEPFITYISLKPRPSYLFEPNATLIRFGVVDEYNHPINGALIKAEILSLECLRGKIAKTPVKKGDNEFYISSPTGRLSIGDHYCLGAGNDNREAIVIAGQLEGLRHYRTGRPFQYDHDRGSPLMPAVATMTDDRGEAAVYFRSLPVKSFNISIIIEYKGKSIIREIKMEEGKTIYLGNVRL